MFIVATHPRKWLLLLDLDGTLWDHLDVSALKPPFKLVQPGVIADSNGAHLRIYRYMIELAVWARRSGGIVASLSWNVPYNALEALRTLRVDSVFDYHLIEPHPWKGRILSKFLSMLYMERRIAIPPGRIIYFDDRDIHLDDIRRAVGPVNYVKSNSDCKNFEECKRLIYKLMSHNGS